MGSLADLPASLKFLTDAIGKNVNTTKQKVASVVGEKVIQGTPVDTGEARSNWIASINEENEDVIQPHSPGSHLGISEVANATMAQAELDKVVALAKPGDEIAICNNVDYIGLLNEGSSRQAPAAFVEMAVQAGVAAVQNAKVVP